MGLGLVGIQGIQQFGRLNLSGGQNGIAAADGNCDQLFFQQIFEFGLIIGRNGELLEPIHIGAVTVVTLAGCGQRDVVTCWQLGTSTGE